MKSGIGSESLAPSVGLPEELQGSADFFRQLIDSAPDAMIVTDDKGVILIANAQCENLLGYKNTELVGQRVEIIIPKSVRDRHVGLRYQFSSNPAPRPMGHGRELKALHKDGSEIDVEVSLGPVQVDGRMLVTAAMRDISDRKTSKRQIEHLASYPQLSPIPIYEMTIDGSVTFQNLASGAAFDDLVDKGYEHPAMSGIEDMIDELRKLQEPISRNITVGEHTFEQQISYIEEFDCVRVYSWDITSLRKLTQKMSYQAKHDALTNLFNRKEFEIRLQDVIDQAVATKGTHALCYIDLDQFKIVNDTCGHAAGDELLCLLSMELKKKIRGNDVLARLGGDEFGLLLESCPLDQAEKIATALRMSISDFRFNWEDKIFTVGASIGMIQIDEHSGSVGEVMSSVDAACYVAKDRGRNQVYVYQSTDEVVAAQSRNMNWTQKIRSAFEHDRWELFCQKIQDVRGVQDHYEILVRMLSEEGEHILPGNFIPAAERYGMMVELDKWVMKNSMLALNEERFGSNGCISINLSGQSLGNAEAMSGVIEELDRSGVETERVCFEITETAMISNLASAEKYLRLLRGMGCKFALDDFGSGLSSFAYLKMLPVDLLKIDRVFVKNMVTDAVDHAMVESINQVGHVMGLHTVAEGAEDRKTVKALEAIGVDYIQGFVIHRPEPISSIKI
ncbi:MAG: EAL domain-containing protein [Proteobacteria bacterium]|nr:EAL domain-containing protein [Pseudomonadota bacterium]